MYLKTICKQIAKEIIEKEKKLAEKNNWDLSFSSESFLQYEELLLTAKEATNYERIFEIDREDLEKHNEGIDRRTLDLWFITDQVYSIVEDLGYEMV